MVVGSRGWPRPEPRGTKQAPDLRPDAGESPLLMISLVSFSCLRPLFPSGSWTEMTWQAMGTLALSQLRSGFHLRSRRPSPFLLRRRRSQTGVELAVGGRAFCGGPGLEGPSPHAPPSATPPISPLCSNPHPLLWPPLLPHRSAPPSRLPRPAGRSAAYIPPSWISSAPQGPGPGVPRSSAALSGCRVDEPSPDPTRPRPGPSPGAGCHPLPLARRPTPSNRHWSRSRPWGWGAGGSRPS